MRSRNLRRLLSSSRRLCCIHISYFFKLLLSFPCSERAHGRLWCVCANWTAAVKYSCFQLFQAGREGAAKIIELQGCERSVHLFYSPSSNPSAGKFATAKWIHSNFPARISPQNLNMVCSRLRHGKMLGLESRILGDKKIIRAVSVIHIHHSRPPLIASPLMS